MHVYSLHQKTISVKQGVKLLSVYYEELTKIFRELDHRDKMFMKDPDNVTTYR